MLHLDSEPESGWWNFMRSMRSMRGLRKMKPPRFAKAIAAWRAVNTMRQVASNDHSACRSYVISQIEERIRGNLCKKQIHASSGKQTCAANFFPRNHTVTGVKIVKLHSSWWWLRETRHQHISPNHCQCRHGKISVTGLLSWKARQTSSIKFVSQISRGLGKRMPRCEIWKFVRVLVLMPWCGPGHEYCDDDDGDGDGDDDRWW
jgi:hypothetical protein